MNETKVFIWYLQIEAADYGKARQWCKIYIVAADEAEARRQLDKMLPRGGLDASLLRMTIASARPKVYATPFAEVNMSNGYRALAFTSAQELV